MRKFLVSAASLIAMTFAASAADMRTYSKAPMPEAVASWTGGYVGLEVGYTSVSGTLGDPDCNYGAADFGCSQRSRAKGFNLGGAIGYDYQVGPSYVLGVVAKVNGVFSEDLKYFDTSDGLGGQKLGHRLEGLASFNARGGYLISPATLLYITGGYAMSQFTTNHWDDSNYDGSKRIFTGWNLGGGVEQKIAHNASMFLEGKYYSFDSKNWFDGVNEHFSLSPNVWTINVGMNYRF